MCAHPLVAICTTSQQAAVLAAPSIWLLRSAVLVTCRRCPWGKWNLTLVSSPPRTLCRWRCNQLSRPLNGADCSSTLKQTGEQNSNCFLYRDVVRDNSPAFFDYHPVIFLFLLWMCANTDDRLLIWMTLQILHRCTVRIHLFIFGRLARRAEVQILFSELPRCKWKQFICVRQEAAILWATRHWLQRNLTVYSAPERGSN